MFLFLYKKEDKHSFSNKKKTKDNVVPITVPETSLITQKAMVRREKCTRSVLHMRTRGHHCLVLCHIIRENHQISLHA
jgi:hypothetical protein